MLGSKLFFFFFFFQKMGFTPCQAEQPLPGMELQGKEVKKDQSIQEICSEPTDKRCVLVANYRAI